MANPLKLNGILEDFLAARGYLSDFRERTVIDNWPAIVGNRLAAASSCREIVNGVLYVRVPAAAWRQEMSFFKEDIMKGIREKTECRTVKDIVFC